ncbi:MAG: carotenoid biosynthesis protein [Candidatus Rokuibacteriota bacterium]
MDLIVATVLLRPYVFAFLAAFLVAGAADLGWRRTLVFGATVWPLAWLSEFASTRVGLPFGLYHYTEATRGRELFIADVPFMDSLSFTFLAYAAFCLARAAAGRPVSRTALATTAGFLMMLLDVVIDPLAVRGDRWFLGHIFYYADGGSYFGVPLSNFAGWWLVGTASVGWYVYWSGDGELGSGRWWPVRGTRGRRGAVGPGVALYYAVLGFNLAITAWIGEWLLLVAGLTIHAAVGAALLTWPRSSAGFTRARSGGRHRKGGEAALRGYR